MEIPTYTTHGLERATERSILDPQELAKLLVSDIALTIGIEKNRHHQLIFSIEDQAHYVGIVDTKTMEIITILHPDYHENCAWRVQLHALEYTRRLAMGIPSELIPSGNPTQSKREERASRHINQPYGKRIFIRITVPKERTIPMGKHVFPRKPLTTEEALADETFVPDVLKKLKSQGIPPYSLLKVFLRENGQEDILIPEDIFKKTEPVAR